MPTQPTASRGHAARKPRLVDVIAAIAFSLAVTGAAGAHAEDVNSRFAFDFGDQSLSQALRDFGQISGEEIIFTEDLVSGRTAPRVKGSFTAAAALEQLLDGSGLIAERSPSGALMIRREHSTYDNSSTGTGAEGVQREGARNGAGGVERLSQSDGNPLSADSANGQSSVEQGTSADSQEPRDEIEAVVVTGSRLTAQNAGAQDVRIHDREAIELSGATNIGTFLNSLPEVSIQNTDSPYQTFAAASTVQLRGLPAGTTLTLINGRRVEISASQSAFGIFDLNNIPLSLVERIEVLPAGSAAVYGGDALAGVVNVVLKKQLDGFETNIGYLSTTDSGLEESTVTAGWGASWERASVSAFASYRKQGELIGAERSITSDQDYTRFGSIDFRSRACYPGSVQTPDGSDLPGLTEPIAAAPVSDSGTVTTSDFTAGVLNLCSDDAARASILPEVDQRSLVVMGGLNLTSSLELYTELMLSQLQKERTRSGLRVSFQDDGHTLGAANPFNPFGIDVGIEYRTPQADVESTETRFTRMLLGMRGSLSEAWNWEVAAWSTTEKSEIDDRFGDDAAIAAALISADTATALNPFESSGPAAALYETIYPRREQKFRARGDAINAFVRGNVPLLPAGPMQIVLGGEARNEKLLEFTNGPDTEDREVGALFAEARVPMLGGTNRDPGSELLALSIAARYDHYSDNFGDSTNPQVGVEFRPTEELLFRGTYSETFKPPGLFALFSPVIEFPFPIFDPTQPPGEQNYNVTLAFGGNPDLKPETGSFESFGVLYNFDLPAPTRLALTYWHAELDDRIGLPFPPQPLIDNEAAFSDRIIRGPDGRITNVDATRLNFGHMETSGVDLQLDVVANAGAWAIKPSLAVTRTLKYDSAITFGLPPEDNLSRATQIGGFAPRWKGTASLGLERPSWLLQLRGRYVGSYLDYDLGGFIADPRDNGDVWYADASFRWTLRDLFGAESTYLQLAATNLFDRQPQFSHYDTFGYDPSQYDIRGRFISLTVGARW
jgi:iron complex outermembrane recepter protein